MGEDKDIARRLAQADFQKMTRDAVGPTAVVAADEAGTAPVDARTMVAITMFRDNLIKRTAREMAETFRKIRARSPASPIMITFTGYDDDPRELWEFPEVCRYLKWWARFAGIGDWRAASAVPWADGSMGVVLLAACGVFGDDHPFDIRFPPSPTAM